MSHHKSNFIKALSKEPTREIPIYCTGYPESQFIDNYITQYNLKVEKNNLILNDKNYSIIKLIGFDAISLWDFRRGKGGFVHNDQIRVDGWGRLYKGNWYMWDGVFKNEEMIENWEHLNLPSEENFINLRNFLDRTNNNFEFAISLPGLFEKTWQSMGLKFFAKCLKKNVEFINRVLSFFSNYLKTLIKAIQLTGATTFLIADDIGYKKRTFIPKEIWRKLFFEEYKEIIHMIHQKTHYVILHSDGYISDMISTFIDLGFDAIQSLEPSAGVDIFNLFKKFKNQICFIGNLDMSLLSFGTPQEVKAYTEKLITKAKKYHCPLVVSPSQQINRKCVPKNINVVIETAKIFK
jgi:uroporphyrinogen decarboxylase